MDRLYYYYFGRVGSLALEPLVASGSAFDFTEWGLQFTWLGDL
jgi:hypothetical protein